MKTITSFFNISLAALALQTTLLVIPAASASIPPYEPWNPEISLMSDWPKENGHYLKDTKIPFHFQAMTQSLSMQEQMDNPQVRALLDLYMNGRTTEGNRATLLINGANSFEKKYEMIKNAQESIYFSTFIWFPDENGVRLLPLIAKKIEEGVTVRIICDALSIYKKHRSFYEDLNRYIRSRYEALKGQYPRFADELKNTSQAVWMFRAPYQPVYNTVVKHDEKNGYLQLKTTNFVSGKFLHINHTKVLLVDGKKAVLGGMNQADSYAYGGAAVMNPETQNLEALPAHMFSDSEIATLKKMLPHFWPTLSFLRGKNLEANPYKPAFGWRDTDIYVEGKIVDELNYSWTRFWKYSQLLYPNDGSHSSSLWLGDAWTNAMDSEGSGLMPKDYLGNNNKTSHANLMMRKVEHLPQLAEPYFYRQMRWVLASARHYVFIHSPYANYPEDIKQWMIEATTRAKNPIKIAIITNSPESNDWKHDLTWSARKNIVELWKKSHGRIHAFEWKLATLHSKVILADDYFVSVGTNNYDIQSMSLSTETSVSVFDREFALTTRKMFDVDSTNATHIMGDKIQEWDRLFADNGVNDWNPGYDAFSRFRGIGVIDKILWSYMQGAGGGTYLRDWIGF